MRKKSGKSDKSNYIVGISNYIVGNEREYGNKDLVGISNYIVGNEREYGNKD